MAGEDSASQIDLVRMLLEENEHLRGPTEESARIKNRPVHDRERLTDAFRLLLRDERWALCLSGGGIRSATFGLGVLQGLAQCGLLKHFDYLSTVSGGGYVGGWLTGWIQRHEEGLDGVARGLVQPLHGKGEPGPIQHLRDYSNYLNPRLGLLSADTWTLVATYLRNLLLHWILLLPPILIVLITPKIGVRLLTAESPAEPALVGGLLLLATAMAGWYQSRPAAASRLQSTDRARLWRIGATVSLALSAVLFALAYSWTRAAPEEPSAPGIPAGVAWTVLGAGVLCLLAGMIFIDWNRPTAHKRRDSQGVVLLLFLTPMMLSALLIPLGWAWLRPTRAPDPWVLAALGIGLRLVSWWLPLLLPPYGKTLNADWPRKRRLQALAMRMLAAVLTGAMGGLLVWRAAKFAAEAAPEPLYLEHPELYACLAPPLLLGIFMLAEIVLIGLASFWTEDEDREWWGRSGAWLLIAVLAWGLLRLVALFGPPLLAYSYAALSTTIAAGGAAGIATAMLGFSSKSEQVKQALGKFRGPTSPREMALSVLAPIFLVALFAILSLGIDLSLGADLSLAAQRTDGRFQALLRASRELTLGELLVAMAFLLAVIGLASLCVNVNKFSLHAMYRYRLIRAFLGASNRRRKPHPFTGFDPRDNIDMHDIWPNAAARDLSSSYETSQAEAPVTGGKRQPLHVINIALNLVGGSKLAWQQRKAESFTVSPLHCGNRDLGYRPSNEYGHRYQGISIGTAMTISGAAASPNMGYHSSGVVTFIMSLFNVRLGWWLGNPGPPGEQTYVHSGPGFAIRPLFAETFGMTNDRNPYVYLSDGGHFENLGLYEMVLRRCRFIVVSDAACDPTCAFEDLGNAIRKIRIDLGVDIEIDRLPMRPREGRPSFGGDGAGRSCAVGTIKYPKQEGTSDGVLIYLKPGIEGGEPVDVLNYAVRNASFPHEPTTDQWFSESQFESYRALGVHIVQRVFGHGQLGRDAAALERRAREYAYPES